jgi:hypothetical protein
MYREEPETSPPGAGRKCAAAVAFNPFGALNRIAESKIQSG